MSFSRNEYRDIVNEAAYDNAQGIANGTYPTSSREDDEFITTGRDREAGDDYYCVYRSMKDYCERNSLFLLEKMELANLIHFLRN